MRLDVSDASRFACQSNLLIVAGSDGPEIYRQDRQSRCHVEIERSEELDVSFGTDNVGLASTPSRLQTRSYHRAITTPSLESRSFDTLESCSRVRRDLSMELLEHLHGEAYASGLISVSADC